MTATPAWITRWGLTQADADRVHEAGWSFAEVARVVSEHRGIFTLATSRGMRLGRLAGRLQRTPARDFPVVGDWVRLAEGATGESQSEFEAIDGYLPRRTVLRRARPNKDEQLVAVNLDLVMIVMAADASKPEKRLEQYVAVIQESDVPWRVVFTKIDLAPVPLIDRQALAVSSVTGAGVDDVRTALADKTTLLVGDSGAGKSSLLNALFGDDGRRVGRVTGLGDGRHTTTARSLAPLPIHGRDGACIIDSPGWRQVRTRAALAEAMPARRGFKTPRTPRR